MTNENFLRLHYRDFRRKYCFADIVVNKNKSNFRTRSVTWSRWTLRLGLLLLLLLVKLQLDVDDDAFFFVVVVCFAPPRRVILTIVCSGTLFSVFFVFYRRARCDLYPSLRVNVILQFRSWRADQSKHYVCAAIRIQKTHLGGGSSVVFRSNCYSLKMNRTKLMISLSTVWKWICHIPYVNTYTCWMRFSYTSR